MVKKKVSKSKKKVAKKSTKKQEKQTEKDEEITINPKYLITVIVIAIIIGGAFYLYPKIFSSTKVEIGDSVKVRYVGMLEDGSIFDTNIPEVAQNNDMQIVDQPLEFVAGAGKVIVGFDNGVLGMKEGEEKRVEIPPEEAYGSYNSAKVVNLPRTREIPRNNQVPRNLLIAVEEFEKAFNESPAEGEVYYSENIIWGHRVNSIQDGEVHLILEVEDGKTYELPNNPIKSTVVLINETTIVFRQDPEEGQIIETNMGTTEIKAEGDKILLKANPELGTVLMTEQGPAKISNMGQDFITVDFNHELAGKKLVFLIEVESIEKNE